jgi:hypothetical protein
MGHCIFFFFLYLVMTMEESESNIVLLNFKSSVITIPGFLKYPGAGKIPRMREGSGKGVNEIGAGTKHLNS